MKIKQFSGGNGCFEAPGGLFDKVMLRVKKERRISALKRLAFYSGGLLFCAAAFIPALDALKSGFIESGFAYFFALMFSDSSIAFVYWRSFAFAFLETLPAMSAGVILTLVFIFLALLKFLAGDLKYLFALKQMGISAIH